MCIRDRDKIFLGRQNRIKKQSFSPQQQEDPQRQLRGKLSRKATFLPSIPQTPASLAQWQPECDFVVDNYETTADKTSAALFVGQVSRFFDITFLFSFLPPSAGCHCARSVTIRGRESRVGRGGGERESERERERQRERERERERESCPLVQN